MSTSQRVVITGLGLVTPLGFDETTVWSSVLAGQTGVTRLPDVDVGDCKTPNGAPVPEEALAEARRKKKVKPFDRTADMAVLAAEQALTQAGLNGEDPVEAATIFGTGDGAARTHYTAFMGYADKGVRGIRPTTVPRGMANSTSAQIAMRFRLTGPNYMVVCACASATVALGTAFRLIRNGDAHVVLAGGAESLLDPFMLAAWNNLGVLSRNPDPFTCCRPFHVDRDGFVLGEGAGALLLESLEHARARGAAVRAELAGYGESSDAHHITRPEPAGQARAITAALDVAGLAPSDIGFVSAHGTGTRISDTSECRALHLALGDTATRVPVASGKCFFGHTLGASGALETILAILSMENGRVPGNINLDRPDPAIDLNLVGTESVPLDADTVLKNSFGFGGNNAVLVLRRWT